MIALGIDHAEAVRLLSGDPIVVDTENVNPLLPPMRIVLLGGASNAEMVEMLRRRWPELWEVPSA